MAACCFPSTPAHPVLLLLLLSLLTTATAAADGEAAGGAAEAAASVHGVSVSVRSARSIIHQGVQVPLFQSAGARQPGRYFFSPLALLDCDATRLVEDREEDDAAADAEETPRRQRVLLTVLLWTDEFLAEARAQLLAASSSTSDAPDSSEVSLELMPLTELTLNWSSQAGRWLGPGFERRLRLLSGWRDAQKPRQRVTFSVACEQRRPEDCRLLKSLLGGGAGDSAGGRQLLDLRYRVRCDSARRLSVPLASRHLLRSRLFRRLRQLASSTSSGGLVLVTESTVDQLAKQLRWAALEEMQERQLGGQRAHSVDPAALAALAADAERLLRRSPVTGAGVAQWSGSRVFWPDGAGLRPDRLAGLLNRLLAPATGDPPGTVRPTSSSGALLAALAEEGELGPGPLAVLRRVIASRDAPIEIGEVRELVATSSIGGPVAWNASTVRFEPSPTLQLFELDTRRLLATGVFAVRDAVLRYRVSEQRDHVTPRCRSADGGGSADFSAASWAAQAALLRLRLRPLLARAANASARLRRLQTQLVVARDAAGPEPWVRHRSGESAEAVPPDGPEVAALSSSIDALSSRLGRLLGSAGQPPLWQGRFADSFCILANYGPPPRGMSCRTVSFVIPKKSLRNGYLLGRSVRLGTGTAGQNLLQPLEGGKFYRFQLRGCCK